MQEPVDPRLVRLVARHFNNLQGLTRAMLGFVLAVADWAWLASSSRFLTALAAIYALLIAIVPTAFYSDVYASLGRVVSKPDSRARAFSRWMPGPIVILWRLESDVLHGLPSLVWLIGSAYPAWLAIDGWPYRSYHLITCAAAVYVAFGLPAAPDPGAFMWAARRLWVFGLALVATGIADHFLLVTVMRPTDDVAEEEASKDL